MTKETELPEYAVMDIKKFEAVLRENLTNEIYKKFQERIERSEEENCRYYHELEKLKEDSGIKALEDKNRELGNKNRVLNADKVVLQKELTKMEIGYVKYVIGFVVGAVSTFAGLHNM